jgi:hypothetical protein
MDFGETYYRGFPIRGFAGWLYDEGVGTDSSRQSHQVVETIR